ncbi:hypothetical protein SmJEL517_g02050 [Synchytrium microbalum]|uniref:Rho-GAP domain-containing protein n=1 Tax=Synchytrium microbalum TaxID=1806994 RepID=A0A507C821_9FUNG|nr:uncharacterized protein SmJEL517_g02050 [Synchytrium microbalum]TPX35468.1 hypothetical protein SmJEL517_g02050 [Synchytrium microbalum]
MPDSIPAPNSSSLPAPESTMIQHQQQQHGQASGGGASSSIASSQPPPLAPTSNEDKLRSQLILEPCGVLDALSASQAEAIVSTASSWKVFKSGFILRKDAPISSLPARPPPVQTEKPPVPPPKQPPVPSKKSFDLDSDERPNPPEDWTIMFAEIRGPYLMFYEIDTAVSPAGQVPPPYLPPSLYSKPVPPIPKGPKFALFNAAKKKEGSGGAPPTIGKYEDTMLTLADLVASPRFLVNYVALPNVKADMISYRSSPTTVDTHLMLTLPQSLDKIRFEPLQVEASPLTESSPVSSLANLRASESQMGQVVQWMTAVQYVAEKGRSTTPIVIVNSKPTIVQNDGGILPPPRGSSTKITGSPIASPIVTQNIVAPLAPLVQSGHYIPSEGDHLQPFVRESSLQPSRAAASLPPAIPQRVSPGLPSNMMDPSSPTTPTSPTSHMSYASVSPGAVSPSSSNNKPKNKIFSGFSGFAGSGFGRVPIDPTTEEKKIRAAEERERERRAAEERKRVAAEIKAMEKDEKRLKKKESTRGIRDAAVISAASKMSAGVLNSVPNFFRMAGATRRDNARDDDGFRGSGSLRRIGPKRDSLLGAKNGMDLMDGEIPVILKKCIKLVEEIGIDTEGLYRISGSAATVDRLRKLFAADPEAIYLPAPPEYTSHGQALLDDDLGASSASKQVHRKSSRSSLSDIPPLEKEVTGRSRSHTNHNMGSSKSLYDNDVHVITGVIKSYLRDGIPTQSGRREPVCTYELYTSLINATRLDEWRDRMIAYQDLVHDLPASNFATLKFLCDHLSLVAAHSAANRMPVKNLAIVFGPTLIRPAPEDETMARMMTDMGGQCAVVEALIEQAEWMFGPIEYEDDDEEALITEDGTGAVETDATAIEEYAGSEGELAPNNNKLGGELGDLKQESSEALKSDGVLDISSHIPSEGTAQ